MADISRTQVAFPSVDGWNLVLVTCEVRSNNLLSVGCTINCHQFPKLALSPKNFTPSGSQADSGQTMLIGSTVSEPDNLTPCLGLSSVIVFDGDLCQHNVHIAMLLLGPEDTTFSRRHINELHGSRDILTKWPDAAGPAYQSLNLERIVMELRSALREAFSSQNWHHLEVKLPVSQIHDSCESCVSPPRGITQLWVRVTADCFSALATPVWSVTFAG